MYRENIYLNFMCVSSEIVEERKLKKKVSLTKKYL